MTNLEQLKEQRELLDNQIASLAQQERELSVLEDIKLNGFSNPNDKILTYQEIYDEWKAGRSTHKYKGVTFETYLEVEPREGVRRVVKILSIKDYCIFNSYHALLKEYDFRQKHYYEFYHLFDGIPEIVTYSEVPQKYLGRIQSLLSVRKSILEDKYTCAQIRGKKASLESSVLQIEKQIDLIEKIGRGETDVRDSVLEKYTDKQLEYELDYRRKHYY